MTPKHYTLRCPNCGEVYQDFNPELCVYDGCQLNYADDWLIKNNKKSIEIKQ